MLFDDRKKLSLRADKLTAVDESDPPPPPPTAPAGRNKRKTGAEEPAPPAPANPMDASAESEENRRETIFELPRSRSARQAQATPQAMPRATPPPAAQDADAAKAQFVCRNGHELKQRRLRGSDDDPDTCDACSGELRRAGLLHKAWPDRAARAGA